MKHTLILISTLFYCLTSFGQGEAYFVAKTGTVSNPGTIAEPFLLISQAASIMQPGDTCYIKGGIYRETLDPVNNGTVEAPIVFKAYNEEEVIISATQVIDGWTIHEGDVYKANIDLPLGRQNMLYFNGELTDRARWPNNEDHDPYTLESISITNGSSSSMTTEDLPQLVDWSGTFLWYLGAHSGTSWTRSVSSVVGKTINFQAVDIQKWPFSPHNPTVLRNGNRGRCYLFGNLELLDYEKEWYYEEVQKAVYFQPPQNADLAKDVVEYAARERTIFLNKNYITIDGINAFGGKVHIKGSHCTVRNGQFSHGLEILDELDNTDAQMGNGSFHVQGSDNLIEHNIIEYGSANGIWVQGWGGVSNNTIRNNIIRYFNTIGTHSSPIRSPSVGTKIIGNTIYGTGRDGIYAPAKDCEIAYNDVYNCMRINNDGGIFYVVGNDENKNTSIHHNWFHDTYGPAYADGRSAGIYLDNRSKGYDVHHNVVWNIDWSGVQMNWDAWNNDIFNNSFWNTKQAMGVWLNGYIQKDNRIWNNYSDVGEWEGQDVEANIIDGSNPFKDSDSQDFRPVDNSFLIDRGIVIDGVTEGFEGIAPDVGAYEWGGEFWLPGVENATLITSTKDLWVEKLMLDVTLYPNPVMDDINFLIHLPQSSVLEWQLCASDQKLIRQGKTGKLKAGENQLRINTNGLTTGNYFITGKTHDGFFVKQFAVQ